MTWNEAVDGLVHGQDEPEELHGIERGEPVLLQLRLRHHREMCRGQAVGRCSQRNATRLLDRADGDTIDPALDRKITRQNVIVVIKKPRDWRRRDRRAYLEEQC